MVTEPGYKIVMEEADCTEQNRIYPNARRSIPLFPNSLFFFQVSCSVFYHFCISPSTHGTHFRPCCWIIAYKSLRRCCHSSAGCTSASLASPVFTCFMDGTQNFIHWENSIQRLIIGFHRLFLSGSSTKHNSKVVMISRRCVAFLFCFSFFKWFSIYIFLASVFFIIFRLGGVESRHNARWLPCLSPPLPSHESHITHVPSLMDQSWSSSQVSSHRSSFLRPSVVQSSVDPSRGSSLHHLRAYLTYTWPFLCNRVPLGHLHVSTVIRARRGRLP